MRSSAVVCALALVVLVVACAKRQDAAPGADDVSASQRAPLDERAAEPAPPNAGGLLAMPGPTARPAAQASSAQAVFVEHCGECHRSDLPTAKPAALKIFDLTKEDWLSGLTPSQLEAAAGRIKGKSVTDDQREAALSALDTEIARRK